MPPNSTHVQRNALSSRCGCWVLKRMLRISMAASRLSQQDPPPCFTGGKKRDKTTGTCVTPAKLPGAGRCPSPGHHLQWWLLRRDWELVCCTKLFKYLLFYLLMWFDGAVKTGLVISIRQFTFTAGQDNSILRLFFFNLIILKFLFFQ